jgi:MoxR-like ATPase
MSRSREKIEAIYDYINENLFFSRPDLEIGGKKYNSALLQTLLVTLNGRSIRIIGEFGLGKTSLARHAQCLIYQYPRDLLYQTTIPGHPDQTKTEMVGRAHLGRLKERGEEHVIFSPFAQLQGKLVDDVPAMPPGRQHIIKDGLETGSWTYLNELITNQEYSIIVTSNYPYEGTYGVIPALEDRIDMMVEAKYPGPNLSMAIARNRRAKKESLLQDKELTHKILETLYNTDVEYKERMREVEELSSEFGKKLDKMEIPSMNFKEREEARTEIAKLDYDFDSDAFLRMLFSELSFCAKKGQKRTELGDREICPKTCDYNQFLCYDVAKCASNRLSIAILENSAALAWFTGADEITLEHVGAVVPGALAARMEWWPHFEEEYMDDPREDTLKIYLGKAAFGEVITRYGRYGQPDQLKSALHLASRLWGKEGAAEKFRRKYKKADHPIYREIERDLARW